ncbi:hypothetical protein [Paraliobacillus sp. JSM ZJ581]|uniref:hypothetical protein n=1 Tax=Paraliobacillus sp. JSM ZJ581 TaxID=3342118 RepID=UPI0035A88C6D
MKRNIRNFRTLDETSIQNEIRIIIEKGLDPKASFWSYLATMYKQIGFRFIFKDFAEILFTLSLSIVVVLSLILTSVDYIHVKNVNLYSIIFIWSPLIYFTMSYFFFINQKTKSTYEVEMTCKYDLFQLAAFRMLLFSVVSMLINSVFIYTLVYNQGLNFFYAFLLSASSLFVFALIFLYVQTRTVNRVYKILFLVVWLIGNLMASYYSSNFYLRFLEQIPIYIYGFIAIGAIMLYIKNLKKLLFIKKMKGMI